MHVPNNKVKRLVPQDMTSSGLTKATFKST